MIIVCLTECEYIRRVTSRCFRTNLQLLFKSLFLSVPLPTNFGHEKHALFLFLALENLHLAQIDFSREKISRLTRNKIRIKKHKEVESYALTPKNNAI